MPKIHVRVKHIEDKMVEYVENHPVEIYVDYRDELSDKQVDEILAGRADGVREEIEMDYYDEEYSYYWEEMRQELGCSKDDVNDWLENDGFYPSHDLTDSGWRQLIRNTSVCITATVWDAEWNFNNWSCGGPVNYSDVKTALKVLGVNPLEFKKLMSGGSMSGGDSLKGWFPDMPDREAKVNAKDLWDNLIVLYDGVLNFCLGDLEDVIEVLKDDSKNIIINKGTNVVMYDFCNGAGITEVKLIGNVTIPRKMVEFKNDKNNKYGIQECYGFVHSYWEEGSIRNEKR